VRLPTDALEHPDAIAEGIAIARSGLPPHVIALGELVRVVNFLFDGAGEPAYVGASRRIEEVFHEDAPQGDVRVFLRGFWGSDEAGVVAVMCVKGGRPVLMSVVAVALPGPDFLFESAAERRALALALQRVNDL
jgi:hypothetical protein